MSLSLTDASPSRREPESLRKLQKTATRFFTGFIWTHVPVIALIAHFNNVAVIGPTCFTLACAAIATLCAWKWPATAGTRGVIAAMMTAMPMVLLHVGMGVWQIDYHMYFFAIFAMLAIYVDWRPVVVSAVLTAIHHLAMSFLMPMSVFPDQAGDGRATTGAHARPFRRGGMLGSRVDERSHQGALRSK